MDRTAQYSQQSSDGSTTSSRSGSGARPTATDTAQRAAITRLIEQAGGSASGDLIEAMIETLLGLIGDGTRRSDLKILNAALRDMRRSFQIFAPHAAVRKVSVFGSARTERDSPEFIQADLFARKMVERDFMVITGGGDGVMRAAVEGAGRDRSFGCLIRLPFEASVNGAIAPERAHDFKYFFTRKLTFVKESDGFAMLPGGFGTLDECFEVLTLIQTGKSSLLPVVFLDAPGGTYWQSLEQHMLAHLEAHGRTSPEDRNLYLVTDDAERAVNEIAGFYRNYHSMRQVGGKTVLRHRQRLSPGQLEQLTAEFGDLAADGVLHARGPLPQEASEPELGHLERLVLRFDRRRFGRMRQLVNRLNELPASG